MDSRWIQGLKTPEEKVKVKEYLANSNFLLDKLKNILYNRIKEVRTTSSNDYETASWAYKQADQNGYLRAYEEIIKLITLDKSDNK